MCMRFERNIGSRAARFIAGLFERDGFRVLDLIVNVEAFADDLMRGIDDYCADEWTGTDLADAARRQLKRARHHLLVEFAEGLQGGLRRGAAKCL